MLNKAVQREVTLKVERIVIQGASMGERFVPLWDGPVPEDVVLTGPFRRPDGSLYATVMSLEEWARQSGEVMWEARDE